MPSTKPGALTAATLRPPRRRFTTRVASASFSTSSATISIVQEQNRLTVRGRLKETERKTYLYRGIASRPFERQFDLADYVEVTGANMDSGLLVIELKRELPEELKPRSIPINSGTSVPIGGTAAGTIERKADSKLAA
jgi:molecular chaperone IbpA